MKTCNHCGAPRMDLMEFQAHMRKEVEAFLNEKLPNMVAKEKGLQGETHLQEWWDEVLVWMITTGKLNALSVLEQTENIIRTTAMAIKAGNIEVAAVDAREIEGADLDDEDEAEEPERPH